MWNVSFVSPGLAVSCRRPAGCPFAVRSADKLRFFRIVPSGGVLDDAPRPPNTRAPHPPLPSVSNAGYYEQHYNTAVLKTTTLSGNGRIATAVADLLMAIPERSVHLRTE